MPTPPTPESLRAQQALAILEVLEGLPIGEQVTVAHLRSEFGDFWGVWRKHAIETHQGVSATDALGQLTQVMAFEGGAP